MQRILEHLTTPEQVSIAMSALSPITISLSMDTFGHHVIDNCLKLFSFEDNMVKLFSRRNYFIIILSYVLLLISHYTKCLMHFGF